MVISVWLLLLSIFASLVVGMVAGALLVFWYLARQLRKSLGIKSWKKFHKQMKEAQELQKQMKEGSFQMDKDLQKKMEEMARKFSSKN